MRKLVNSAQMRAADQAAIEEYGLPGRLLMEHAGVAVARAAAAMVEGPSRHVTIVCGRGNNGGDGFVAARWLLRLGCVPEVFLVGDPTGVSGDALANLELYRRLGPAVEVIGSPDDLVLLSGSLRRAGLCIDALLGTGVAGAPREPAAAVIRAVAAAGVPVLAVDLPSGVDADTGACAEPHLIAERTVTFGALKRGLAVYPGAAAAGVVEVVDIGLPPAVLDSVGEVPGLLEPADIAALVPERPPAMHKGDAGRAVIIGGSVGLGGAVALAGRAAARGGAGLVWVAVPDCLADAMEQGNLEVMSRPLRDLPAGHVAPRAFAAIADLVKAADAVAIGPGLGRSEPAAELLESTLAGCRRPLVLDADALNLLAEHDGLLAARRGELVLTPHPGEAARLLGVAVETIERDRFAAAEGLARRFEATVILKGARSLIAAPGVPPRVNPTGNPAMAAGGMGDALCGLVCALLAQGLEPLAAAVAATWLHGRAGDLATGGADAGLLASDLIDQLPAARAELREHRRPRKR